MERLREDIRDLKTAQTKPSIITTYYGEGDVQTGYYSEGLWRWRINYEDDGNTSAPITMTYNEYVLRPYQSGPNTQIIEKFIPSPGGQQTAAKVFVASTRPIASIEQLDEPSGGAWVQVLSFNPSNMGSAAGMCLLNCMQGFGIAPYPGGSEGAYEDMLRNLNAGTLHEEIYPPDDVSVPVYIRTGAPHEHIGVWHRGTFYSDGVIINNWVQYYGAQNIYGWGELCDGIRVVESA